MQSDSATIERLVGGRGYGSAKSKARRPVPERTMVVARTAPGLQLGKTPACLIPLIGLPIPMS
jgi:hypothetical protein